MPWKECSSPGSCDCSDYSTFNRDGVSSWQFPIDTAHNISSTQRNQTKGRDESRPKRCIFYRRCLSTQPFQDV